MKSAISWFADARAVRPLLLGTRRRREPIGIMGPHTRG